MSFWWALKLERPEAWHRSLAIAQIKGFISWLIHENFTEVILQWILFPACGKDATLLNVEAAAWKAVSSLIPWRAESQDARLLDKCSCVDRRCRYLYFYVCVHASLSCSGYRATLLFDTTSSLWRTTTPTHDAPVARRGARKQLAAAGHGNSTILRGHK